MTDDPGERARVYAKIAPVIMAFHDLHVGETFHAEELRTFVTERVPEIAPASPDRILRALRLGFRLNYVVLDRRNSLYQFRPVIKPTDDDRWWELAGDLSDHPP
jgi:hypothetical protein